MWSLEPRGSSRSQIGRTAVTGLGHGGGTPSDRSSWAHLKLRRGSYFPNSCWMLLLARRPAFVQVVTEGYVGIATHRVEGLDKGVGGHDAVQVPRRSNWPGKTGPDRLRVP